MDFRHWSVSISAAGVTNPADGEAAARTEPMQFDRYSFRLGSQILRRSLYYRAFFLGKTPKKPHIVALIT
jgi:hypothetical protein